MIQWWNQSVLVGLLDCACAGLLVEWKVFQIPKYVNVHVNKLFNKHSPPFNEWLFCLT